MARPLRIEYPGAIYHVLSRGDRREAIFRTDADRKLFLDLLGQTCRRTVRSEDLRILAGVGRFSRRNRYVTDDWIRPGRDIWHGLRPSARIRAVAGLSRRVRGA